MTDLTFTRADIDGLTEKLGSFATQLNESEWDLLLAIFAVAVDYVESSPDKKSGRLPASQIRGDRKKVENPSQSTSAELRDQFRYAFSRGKPGVPIIDRVTPVGHPPKP